MQTDEHQRTISEQKQSIPNPIQFQIPYLFSMEFVWETFNKYLVKIIEDIASNIQLHLTKRILDRKLTEFIRDRFIGCVIKDTFKCLPPYADDFCQAIIDLLFKHRESCYKLFLSIVERNDSPETSIYSNESVKDQDINHHILKIPVFYAFIRMAKQQNTSNNDKQEDNADNIRFRQMTELKHY
ncbi:unnamed protein product [Rotaria socialis]|uniref:Uncharacterized protein n=1 Tax=Rotaria socialis TaxID=392032 RepID=A0A820L220_9BILA|nr:unnamed protein product [Rotaria socialis]CAF4352169.1 unnamed protein product [Rotaria socialis]CAF4605117.1 unnamed protein product [Rotaria socialis]CAF4813171.1 unnamed protein product [Rotaria socialis]